jgi:hypothetical protein
MISMESSGSFKHTEKFLKRMSKLDILRILDQYGAEGAKALASATPKESGLTAKSWGHRAYHHYGTYTLVWTNSDVESGFPVAIMLQYGYATGTGGYVKGEDYINPAIRPIFDKISKEVWKVVTSA